jgi:hypothetical protein
MSRRRTPRDLLSSYMFDFGCVRETAVCCSQWIVLSDHGCHARNGDRLHWVGLCDPIVEAVTAGVMMPCSMWVRVLFVLLMDESW